MITKGLRIESFTPEGLQFPMPARNGRLSKCFQGGEDLGLSFDLDRDPRIDYRDVAYGNTVVVRRGLNAVWKGEMRQITQGKESLTVGCVGQWIHLDDKNYGGRIRIWCDNRYKKWIEMSNNRGFGNGFTPQQYAMDTNDRLFIAPRKNESFRAGAGLDEGSHFYFADKTVLSPLRDISRVSFDYDVILPSDWTFQLWYWGAGIAVVWQVVGVTQSGVKDITLPGLCYALQFTLWKGTGPATYSGNTGVDCYAEVTNLRVWGQTTESPSVIHVADDVIDQVEAASPIDASHDLVQEQLAVRDTFTDANGVLLANHQPDVDALRGGWTVVVGGYDIQGNQANCTALGGAPLVEAVAVADSGLSDGIVACDIPILAAGTHAIGIVFRYQDANNFWIWQIHSNGNAYLGYIQAGAWIAVSTLTLGMERSYWYHLMVKMRADRIDCYIGGIWRTGTNNALFQTETEHGIRDSSSTGGRHDNFEVYQALPLWPLFYEDGESCYAALKDAASFGDWDYRALGWGVETGGDRVYLREADRESVRYVIPAQYCRQLSSRGETQRGFYSSGWAKYIDEEGMQRFTVPYYVHVTNDGLEVNTTATGDDLASVVYGVDRDHVFDFGRVDEGLAVEYLQQALRESGHPQVKASIEVYGPVQDLHRGGALIEPVEMEMGYLVRIPYFRATEAQGGGGVDLRDYDTTLLMVGLDVDLEGGTARLIPEGAQEDLERIIKYARAFVQKEETEHIAKRSRVIGG